MKDPVYRLIIFRSTHYFAISAKIWQLNFRWIAHIFTSFTFLLHSDEERRFMYKINQGHLTVFCIVFVWLGGPPSPVRIMTQVPWFMYQNRLGPSGGIYYPNFVPCFVVVQLNFVDVQLCFDWSFRVWTTNQNNFGLWARKMLVGTLWNIFAQPFN